MSKPGFAALFGAVLLAAVAHAEPASTSAKPIPTIDFARKSVFIAAKISPNGDYVAVRHWLGDQIALGIIDLKTHKISASMRLNRDEHVGDFWWVGPDRVVVEAETRVGPLDIPALTGELWGVKADGSGSIYLFGYRGNNSLGAHGPGAVADWAFGEMIDPLPRDPIHALIASYPWIGGDGGFVTIYKLDVRSGAKAKVGIVPGYPPFDVAADDNGKPLFAYANDRNSKYHGYVWSDDKSDWVELEFPNGPPKQLDHAFISGDGKSAFTIVSDATNRGCLDEIVLATRQFKEIGCDEGLNASEILFSHDGSRRPIGVARTASEKAAYFASDDPDVKLMKALHNTFPDQRLTVTSETEDGSKLVLHAQSDRNPGDFYLFDRATQKAEFLIATRDWIDPRQMQPRKVVEYTARDGTVIHAILTKGAGTLGKAPLVVLPHGGPHSGIHDTWVWGPLDHWAQFLANRGYDVLQPNFRGSGGYGYAFEHAGYRHWGTLMIDDITDAARWAIAQGIADPQRMCIFGASWGGYATMMSLVREPDLYQCGVAFAGVYDLPSQISDTDGAQWLIGRNYLDEAIGTDSKELAAQSSINYVDRLKAPVFLVHGTEDRRVPFSQAKKLRKALEKAGKPYEWMEVAHEGHGFWKDENNVEFLDKLAAFLDKNIGNGASPPPQ
ncbi:MAG TPA: S9 family peptidase [Nevskiaceae bacterium]|nr:S9 family peptidase [Nevskiaceae bacterium]